MKTVANRELRASSMESIRVIAEFYANHPEAVIATVSPEGRPHTAVVYISATDTFDLIFALKKETLKYENIRHNRNISITCFDPFTSATVTAHGEASLIGDNETQTQWIRHLQKASAEGDRSHTPPFISLNEKDFAVYKLTPDAIHMVTYLKLHGAMYDFHESIEFVAPGH